MTNATRRDESAADSIEEFTQQQPATDEPSWFLEGENQPTREELIARYRKHFNLPEDGVSLAPRERPASTMPGYRDLIATPRAIERSRFMSSMRDEEELFPLHRDAVPPEASSLRRTYILAALGAMLAGGSVGFVASQVHNIRQQVTAAITTPATGGQDLQSSAAFRPVAARVEMMKPVATASLQVEDAAGAVNSLIPLALRAEPAWPQGDLLLKITGLPEKAYLTSGQRQADKVWSLTLADLKDVKLMVPAPSQPEISVAVAAIEPKSGELAAPVQTMTIAISGAAIIPVSSPPPQSRFTSTRASGANMPSPIPVPMNMDVAQASLASIAQDLIAQGDAKLKAGDAVAARQIYERAWAGGLPEGAMSMARTFDPAMMAPLHLKVTMLDTPQALLWYERAARAGQQEAFAAIVRLKAKP